MKTFEEVLQVMDFMTEANEDCWWRTGSPELIKLMDECGSEQGDRG